MAFKSILPPATALLVPLFIGATALSSTASADAAPRTPQAPHSDQKKTIRISPDARWASTYFTSRGLERFLMLEKKSGNIIAVDNGTIAFSVPAVSGKIKGDDLEPNNSTPAGIWPLTISEGQKDIDAAILFVDGDNYGWDYSLLIHRAAPVREQFLNAGIEGKFKRRSAGCIVLKNSPEAYDRVSEFIQSAEEKSFTTIDGDPSVRARFLIVLPELSSAEEFFTGKKPAPPSPKPK